MQVDEVNLLLLHSGVTTLLHLVRRQRLAEIDAADLRTDVKSERYDFDVLFSRGTGSRLRQRHRFLPRFGQTVARRATAVNELRRCRLRDRRSPTILAQLAASLSCVFVSKSLASCRSSSCSDGSPAVRLTMRPRLTAGRAQIWSVQRCTFLYSCTLRNSAPP